VRHVIHHYRYQHTSTEFCPDIADHDVRHDMSLADGMRARIERSATREDDDNKRRARAMMRLLRHALLRCSISTIWPATILRLYAAAYPDLS